MPAAYVGGGGATLTAEPWAAIGVGGVNAVGGRGVTVSGGGSSAVVGGGLAGLVVAASSSRDADGELLNNVLQQTWRCRGAR